MKIEPVKNFETNTLSSNLFRFSFESEANAVMMVIAWYPYSYEPTAFELVASTLSFTSLCALLWVIIYSSVCKINNIIHKREKQGDKNNNKIKTIILIVLGVIFLSTLPTSIDMLKNAKNGKYDTLPNFFSILTLLCNVVFLPVLVMIVYSLVERMISRFYAKEKGSTNSKRMNIKLGVIIAGLILYCCNLLVHIYIGY